MNFLDKNISGFIIDHTTEESEQLKVLDRNTHLKTLKPRMLSGNYQGRFLSMISKLIRPHNILEIGTFTGYSALCLAEGLRKNGNLITIDCNEETNVIATEAFKSSHFSNQIIQLTGNAISLIAGLNYTFDLVFIDADKENYLNYYSLCFDKLNEGGVILADNVLWSGKVVDKNSVSDKKTKALIDFCNHVQNDSRVENILLPIRDGILMARKI